MKIYLWKFLVFLFILFVFLGSTTQVSGAFLKNYNEKNKTNLTQVLEILASGKQVSGYFFHKFINLDYESVIDLKLDFEKIKC